MYRRASQKGAEADGDGRDSLRSAERLQPDEEDASVVPETYASVFVEYMNQFNFE